MTGIQTIKSFFDRDDVRKRFETLLGKRASAFLTSLMSAVTANDQLAKADPMSVYTSALVAATLDLPINPNLWFAYIVPYNGKAQFQMGYKGFIQLAQRSGLFKTISATPVYEWQIVTEDPLQWFEFDRTAKESDKVVGYASYFKLLNGFEKTLYMTIEELEKHWSKFSASYKRDKSKNKSSSLRSTDFDSMATKTVLKLLLSKYAPLSVEMQTAVTTDQSVIKDENFQEVEYVDNDQEVIAWMELDDKLKEVKSLDDSEKEDDK